jgi:hypothetical protein
MDVTGCTAGEDGFECAACADRRAEEHAYYARQWAVATLDERDPEAYLAALRDAGRA